MNTHPFSVDLLHWLARALLLAAHLQLFWWLRCRSAVNKVRTTVSWAFLLVGLPLMLSSDLFAWDRLLLAGGRAPLAWRLATAVWVAGISGAYVALLALRAAEALSRRWGGTSTGSSQSNQRPSLTRRRIISTATRLAVVAPFAVAGYGTFVARTRFEVREVDLAIPNLPAGLDGIRLAQLTDIHCGPYLPPKDLETVVGMVSETKPHVAVVTGDLITRPGDPLEKCLQLLSQIRAEAGVYHCLGNHERYSLAEDFTENYSGSLGMEILRKRSRRLRFGGATLNLCGVDYQRKHLPYLTGAEQMVTPGALNVLLSHNPDVFPTAADMGYDLVVGGHTHGGQVTLEIVEQWVNAAHFFTPFVAGAYRRGNSTLYVSRGIGTINLPMRVGALPEITLLQLRRA